jgi:hypothetical protein
MQHKEIFLNVYVCENLSDKRNKTAGKQLPLHLEKIALNIHPKLTDFLCANEPKNHNRMGILLQR